MASGISSAPRLGKYRLDRRLAVGGMAEIFLAVAEGLGGFEKKVVIKRLLPQHARDPELRAMFLDEARLQARLRDPHVVEVYDVGQAGQVYYLAMEHVEGIDLRELLGCTPGAPLPWPIALQIVVAVATGLHRAHELRDDEGKPLQIVHRDISPSNVLLGFGGEIKLTDFGVAKWAAQRSLTRQGTLKGKCAYMSPEQCRAEPLDCRSDVFALGVLLFELLTGRRPFDADNDFSTMQAIVAGSFVSPRTLVSELPDDLETAIGKALSPLRDDRFDSAAAFATAVHAAATAHGLIATPGALAELLQKRVPTFAGAPENSAEESAPVRTQTDHASARAAPLPQRSRVRPWLVVALGAVVAAFAWWMVPVQRVVQPTPSLIEKTPVLAVPVPAVSVPEKSVAAAPAPVANPPSAVAGKGNRRSRVRALPEKALPLWDPDSPLPP